MSVFGEGKRGREQWGKVSCTPSFDDLRGIAGRPGSCDAGRRIPTFADALAFVRREIWTHETFRRLADDVEIVKVPRVLVERLTETLCYVA